MISSKYFILLFIFSFCYLHANSYDKTKIKNRESLQNKYGMFKNKKYNYIDNNELKNNLRIINKRKKRSSKSTEVNIGNVNIGQRSKIREVHNYVDAKGGIRIKGKTNAKIGVVTIEKNNNIRKINNNVVTKRKIKIGQ